MSKTPLTDALHCRLVKASEGKDWIAGKDYCDMRAHAAKLETDRAELVELLQKIYAAHSAGDYIVPLMGDTRALLARLEADK